MLLIRRRRNRNGWKMLQMTSNKKRLASSRRYDLMFYFKCKHKRIFRKRPRVIATTTKTDKRTTSKEVRTNEQPCRCTHSREQAALCPNKQTKTATPENENTFVLQKLRKKGEKGKYRPPQK